MKVHDSNQIRRHRNSSVLVLNEKGEYELSPCFRFIYLLLIVSIVSGIAAWQGLLTKDNESDMISIQARNQCNQMFDVIERGWEEIESFTQAIAAGVIAHNLDESVDKWLVLRDTDAVQSMKSKALRVNHFLFSFFFESSFILWFFFVFFFGALSFFGLCKLND